MLVPAYKAGLRVEFFSAFEQIWTSSSHPCKPINTKVLKTPLTFAAYNSGAPKRRSLRCLEDFLQLSGSSSALPVYHGAGIRHDSDHANVDRRGGDRVPAGVVAG
jgi:hypothetical protein